jgi:hypothetical protein
MWHVTLTVAGPTVDQGDIKAGLERLSFEHPFLLSGRFTCDRAEVRYWEEAASAAEVSAMALGLWTEHRMSAHLPEWEVVGVEIVDQETFRRRGRYGHDQPGLVGIGRVLPL